MADPVVETAHGSVRGRVNSGVQVFQGIRYGASTAGHNRFRPPQPPAPWSRTADALGFGPCAPQTSRGAGPRNPATAGVRTPGLELFARLRFLRGDEPESEDCLFLNVWSAGLGEHRRRPVMVWLHGGGFNAGAGSSPLCDGTALARTRDLVVVTLNHRLGSLGYAYLDGAAPNAGMLDIVAALEWVRDNIAAFGGDPGRVTLFGQSGGGWKVSTLLGMPAARGLFQRAIVQSGPGVRMADPAHAAEMAERLVAGLGPDPRRVAVDELLRAQTTAEAALGPRLFPNVLKGFVPVVDGEVLPAHPFAPVAAPSSADVPIIVGHTRTEMTPYYDEGTLSLPASELELRATALAGERAAALLARYHERHPQATPARLYASLHSDLIMQPFAPVLAERHAALGVAPSYLYVVAWETPVLDGRLMAPHGLDVPMVFGTADEAEPFLGAGARPRRLSERMLAAWAAFAESGDPNAGDLPRWPAYDSTARTTMVFDEECRAVDDPLRTERELALGVLSA